MSSKHFTCGLFIEDKILVICYGFGDAPRNGFGSTWNKQNSSEISYHFRIWDGEDNKGKSSNHLLSATTTKLS